MKKYFNLLIVLVAANITLNAQTVWDDFDNDPQATFGYFDGIGFNQNYPNSVSDLVNNSDTCARYDRNGGVQYDVILVEPNSPIIDIADFVDSSKRMSIKVWSGNPGATIQITMESSTLALPGNYPTGRHSVYTVVTTANNAWEDLEFNFIERPDGAMADSSVDRMVILFAPNTFTSNFYLFDSLVGPTLGVNPCDTVVNDTTIHDDFECQRNMSYDFANGNNTVEENPLMSGVNTSGKCGKIKKWPSGDGAFGGHLNNVFSSNDYQTAHISLYDPAAPSDFLVILQDANDTTHFETTITTTSDSSWVEYMIDISTIPANVDIDGWIMLINPGTAPEDSIYYDDFRISNEVVIGECDTVTVDLTIHEDFECQRNMSFDFVNGDNSVVSNPNMTTINMSEKCGMIKKWVDPDLNDSINVPNDGAFGGKLDNPFTTADYKTVNVSLYSPAPASEFIVMVRDASDNTLLEQTFNTSSSSDWEEFKMDISSIPTTTSITGWLMLINPGTNTADSIFYDNFRISNDTVNSITSLEEYSINIYPNPVNDLINVSVKGQKINKLVIYSIDGVLQMTTNSNSEKVSCDVSMLNNGVYFISAELDNGQIVNQKFIK